MAWSQHKDGETSVRIPSGSSHQDGDCKGGGTVNDKEERIIDAIICGGVWGLLLFAAAMIVRGVVMFL